MTPTKASTPATTEITTLCHLNSSTCNSICRSFSRVSPLLQAFAGENFNGYINSLRLEYSLVLLKDFENYTVEAVAIDSGFNTVRTYQRIFREKYGMTPAEYRKTLK